MWMHQWGLTRDPFASPDSPYVALAAHDEAISRLVHSIETAQPLAIVTAPAGLGKSTVLRQALAIVSSPWRQLALVSCPSEGALLFCTLALQLGARIEGELTRQRALNVFSRACRLAGLQRCQVVLAIDGCDEGVPANVRDDIAALVRMRGSALGGPTVILVGRAETLDSPDAIGWNGVGIGLEPLTRSQTERFLTQKLEHAGSAGRIFTPRAITRLHGWSRGVPRELEQLATLALKAGASRGLEAVTPDLVDEIAASCGHVPSLATRWPLAVPG